MIAIIRSLDVVLAVAVGGAAACVVGAVVLVVEELRRANRIIRRAVAIATAPPADPDLWDDWGWTE